jgi:hypothetical protein
VRGGDRVFSAFSPRSVLEKEGEEKLFSPSSFDPEGARNEDRADPRRIEQLDAKLKTVVMKRLHGRVLNNPSDATPAWDRPKWDPSRQWSGNDREQLVAVWQHHQLGQLTTDTATALELWSPPTATTAVELLAQRSDTRNPSGRLLDAAIWGYHAFFPPSQPAAPTTPSWKNIAQALAQFSDREPIDHLQSYVRDPERLEQKAAVAIATGRIRLDDLAPLRLEPAELTKIAQAADDLANDTGTLT